MKNKRLRSILSLVLTCSLLLSATPVHALVDTDAVSPVNDEQSSTGTPPGVDSTGNMYNVDPDTIPEPLPEKPMIQVREGLSNVALGKTSTASSQEANSVRAALAFDGNTTAKSSRWGSNVGDRPAWIQVDLGQVYEIDHVKIYWERPSALSYSISAGETTESMQDVKSFDVTPTVNDTIAFDAPVSARYVRLTINDYLDQTEGTAKWDTISIYEMEVYADALPEPEPDPEANLAQGKTASANGVESGTSFTADKAFDGVRTGTSRWASNVGQNQKWLKVDLGTERTIKKMLIYWERRNATDYKIQVSNDGSTWDNVAAFTEAPADRRQSIVLEEAVKARYVRLLVDDFNPTAEGVTWATVSVYEMEIYQTDVKFPEDYIPASMVVDQETNELVLPDIPGYTVEYIGTDYEQVIDADRAVHHPIIDTNVITSIRLIKGDFTQELNIPVLVKGAVDVNTGNSAPSVIPELREWVGGEGDFVLSASSKIVIDSDSLRDTAEAFASDFEDVTGQSISIEVGSAPDDGDFFFTLGSDDDGLGKEGYLMTVSDSVIVEAQQNTGAYWATRTILQILKQNGDTIPQGQTRDYPKFSVRGMSMDVGRKPFSEEFLDDLMKNMSWYKLNDLQMHLNDNYIWLENYSNSGKDPMDAYSGFRLESSIVGENGVALTSTDEFYTKEWFGNYIDQAKARGINVVPEFDTPAHSLALTKVRPDLRKGLDGRNADHLDLTNQLDASLEFVQSIFDEYMTGTNPTFRQDTIVHVGTDEYSGANKNFCLFMDGMMKYVQDTGRTVRAWGSLTSANYAAPVRSEGVQLNMWYPGYADPQRMYEMGYDMINTRDANLYIVPGADYYHDYLDTRGLYNNWTPYDMGTSFRTPAGSPQMLGANFAVWNDLIDEKANGLSQTDIYDRIAAALPTMAEKNWGEAKVKSYEEMNALASDLGVAPNSNPRMALTSVSGKTVASYSFTNEKDTSANGNDGALQNAAFVSGGKSGKALSLTGGASSFELPIGTAGSGNSVELWVKMDASASGEQVLLESENAAIKIRENGQIGFSREEYDSYTFGYTLPKGEWVKLRFTGTMNNAQLYVNDELVSTLNKANGGLFATMYLPLERIGSKTSAFQGLVDDMIVSIGTDAPDAPPVEEDDKPEVSVSGGTFAGFGEDIVYALNFAKFGLVEGVQLEFEVDSSLVYHKSTVVSEGFTQLGDIKWLSDVDGVARGRIILAAFNGGKTIGDAAEVLRMSFGDKAISGTSYFRIADIKVTRNNAEGVAVYIDHTVTTGTAQTILGNRYDFDKNGVIDLLDLTMMMPYYMSKVGSADWASAQRFDVNNDNVVDMSDLLLVLTNFTA